MYASANLEGGGIQNQEQGEDKQTENEKKGKKEKKRKMETKRVNYTLKGEKRKIG
jgi:hypothetical protein